MHKGFLKTAFVLAALSVVMGAFAAHGLKDLVSDKALATFDTAVRYQFYHAFALIITGIIYKEFNFTALRIAGWLFITGILLFSGSLYLLAIVQGTVQPGYRWLGAITPFGGLAFIAGWSMLFVGLYKKKRSPGFSE
jgi:uncharacterized membrane protein YgdD (TMEM256/DUF423 family)